MRLEVPVLFRPRKALRFMRDVGCPRVEPCAGVARLHAGRGGVICNFRAIFIATITGEKSLLE
ncbi:hypothetical protein [Pleurocapsa sp. FMAR1]|uniref:hypothetical protein n=1 Tax=Pleurocapsa sp. FMAR1 TaxID=3040204 RepID=UPI0029C68890|nr:hypothetical protein [Pleurocapsa sp. FMAR1]